MIGYSLLAFPGKSKGKSFDRQRKYAEIYEKDFGTKRQKRLHRKNFSVEYMFSLGYNEGTQKGVEA